MSSSGAHTLLWCISHTFEFQACGSPATYAATSAPVRLGTELLNKALATAYRHIFYAKKHGRGFAELGVSPPVRLERL